MGQCSSKPNIRSVVPYSSEQVSEMYLQNSPNLTKRRIKRTRSKIILDAFSNKNT